MAETEAPTIKTEQKPCLTCIRLLVLLFLIVVMYVTGALPFLYRSFNV